PVAAAPAAAPLTHAPAKADDLLEVTSPMVGTFYSSPSPDSDAFVKIGARIAQDTVVCIVEAMKVMNEIKAECSGVVTESCVENAQPVEYGQVLFRVRP
ncbi:MAG: acetyl-CoA carboxylase biotin carboxyl carrier protein, partial [Planctomycetota bacterium]|nr:acetyl-CoA carboxylase biotin carboxyl carrier protein [Planctomycetota bacterium]